MALETQMVDIPLTLGVDTKMTDKTNLDTQFSEIVNMRSDFTGGFLPRAGYTAQTQPPSGERLIETPAWMASTPTRTIYSTLATIRDTSKVPGFRTNFAMPAAGQVIRQILGSQIDVDPQYVACCAVGSQILVVWAYSTLNAINFQFYTPSTGELGGSGYIGTSNPPTDIQVVMGADNPYVWWIEGGSTTMAITEISTSTNNTNSQTFAALSAVPTVFDVVYNTTAATYFLTYSIAGNTYIVPVTRSGTTFTRGTQVAMIAAASTNVAIVISSTEFTPARVMVTYYSVSTLYSKSYNSLTMAAIDSYSTSITGPMYSLGICDALGTPGIDGAYITFSTYATTNFPRNYSLTFSLSGGGSTYNSAFGIYTSPIARKSSYVSSYSYLPAVGAVDIQNVATYSSAGLIALSAGSTLPSYRWSTASAKIQLVHRGPRIILISGYSILPQLWEGRIESITTATSGFDTYNTQTNVGIIVINENKSTFSKYFKYGTAEVVAGGSCYGLDSQGIGPQSAWPIPTIDVATLATQAGGSLDASSRYSYRLVKQWADTNGNIIEAVSPPFVKSTTTDLTIKFTVRGNSSEFSVPQNTAAGLVKYRLYRTEGNASIHYFHSSRVMVPSTSWSVVDTIADASLDFSDALTYDGGELEDTELAHVNHMTTFQDRLVALTADYPSKVFYSKPPEDYRQARFANGLEIAFPHAKGGLVGIAGMDYTLYGFARNEIYAVSGQPAGATGENGSLGVPEVRFTGIGCTNAKSILVTPKGTVFQSDKGVYIILRNQELTFIGDGPFSSRTTEIVGAFTDVARSEFKYVLSTGVWWIYNWEDKLWTSFTSPVTPLAVSVEGSLPTLLSSTGVYKEDSGSSEVIPLTMSSAWIATAGIEGFQRVRNIMLLLDYVAAHTLTINIYTDYNDTTAVQTYTINTATDIATTDPYQIRLNLQNQKCESLRIKITSATAGWKISGLSMEVGVKPGHYKSRFAPNTF